MSNDNLVPEPQPSVFDAVNGVLQDEEAARRVMANPALAIITMTLTTPACPLTDLIEDECASTLAGLVEEFRIDWTWNPRWTMERITPEGRDQLAALGFSFDNMPKY